MARKKSGIEKSGTDGLFDSGSKQATTSAQQAQDKPKREKTTVTLLPETIVRMRGLQDKQMLAGDGRVTYSELIDAAIAEYANKHGIKLPDDYNPVMP